MKDGIAFAGARDGATGLYLDTTCVDSDYDGNGTPDAAEKLLPKLSIDPAATWDEDQGPPCGGDVALISNAAQFSDLLSTDLRNWGCSVHESFRTFPTDWAPLAIATDTASHPTCGTEVGTGTSRCGEAYILVSGVGVTATAPNLALDPTTGTGPVGTSHTVTASVTNDDASARPGETVKFLVTGANPGAPGTCMPADCTSGSDGKVAFTYTGAAEGDDTINASVSLGGSTQTATAAMTWTTAPPATPTPAPTPPPLVSVPSGGVLGQQAASCGSQRLFRITIRRFGLRRVSVRVHGRNVHMVRRHGRFTGLVDLRNLKHGTYVVRILARTKSGKLLRGSRTYHTCAKKVVFPQPPRL
jgi:hypothetical protein